MQIEIVSSEQPVRTCQKGLQGIWEGEKVYHMNGKIICCDCFDAAVRRLLDRTPEVLADMMGIDYEEA